MNDDPFTRTDRQWSIEATNRAIEAISLAATVSQENGELRKRIGKLEDEMNDLRAVIEMIAGEMLGGDSPA